MDSRADFRALSIGRKLHRRCCKDVRVRQHKQKQADVLLCVHCLLLSRISKPILNSCVFRHLQRDQ